MDFSKLSDQDLQALSTGNMTGLSDDALQIIAGAGTGDSSPTGSLELRPFGIDTDVMMPEGVSEFAVGAGRGFTDIGQGIGQLFGLYDEKDVEEKRKIDAPLNKSGYATAGNVTSQILSALAGGSALKGLGAAGQTLGLIKGGRALGVAGEALANPATFKGAIGGGAALGAIQPTAQGDSRAINSALGAAGGGLGYGLASGVGRVLRPNRAPLSAADQATADFLESKGVNLDALDLTESKPLKILESVFENLPFTAGAAGKRAENRAAQFTGAALRSIGSTGSDLNGPVLNEASRRIGSQFDSLIEGQQVLADAPFFQSLRSIVEESDKLPQSLAPKGTSKTINELLSMEEFLASGQSPSISPETYQLMSSALAKKARAAKDNNPQAADVFNSIRDSLDDLVERNMGGDKLAQWKDARRQWRNFKILDKAADNTITARSSGHIRPQDLSAAVKQVGKESRTRGKSELAELSRAGERFANTTPDSGTAQRMAMQQMMTGGLLGGGAGMLGGGDPTTMAGAVAAGIIAPKTLQRLMYSPAMKGYMKSGIVPEGLEQLGQSGRAILTRGTPSLLGGPQE